MTTNLNTKPSRSLVIPPLDGTAKVSPLYGHEASLDTLWGSEGNSHFVDVLSVGPITSITDMTLDETPYTTEEFPNSKFFAHTGGSVESPWKGRRGGHVVGPADQSFPYVERTYNIGKMADLLDGPDADTQTYTTFNKSVSGVGVQGIRLNFVTNTFVHRDWKNRRRAAKASFQIQLLDEAGVPVLGYTAFKEVFCWAINPTAYQLTLFPPAGWSAKKWSYRVTMGVRYSWHGTHVGGNWTCSTVTEMYKDTQDYSNIAFVSGSIVANDVSGKIPARRYLASGYKISVPALQHINGRDVFTGQFKKETSNSHAWNAMAVLTDDLVFAGLPIDKINIVSFLEFDRYCARTLGGERAFSFSQYLIKATNFYKLASQIVGAADGKLYEDTSGRIGVLIDKKEDARRVITSYDIVNEDIKRTSVPTNKRTNYVSGEFEDKANSYAKTIIHEEDPVAQAKDGLISEAIKLDTCTSEKEARRVILGMLKTSQYITATYGMTLGHNNEDLQVGEILEIYDRHHSRVDYCGKTGVGSTALDILIDPNTPIDLTGIPSPQLIIDVSGDRGIQRINIASWTATSIKLQAPLSSPPPEFISFGVTSREDQGLKPSLARVLKISDGKSGYEIECLSYNHTLQDHIENGTPLIIPIDQIIPKALILHVENLVISKGELGLEGRWDRISGDSFIYQWKRDTDLLLSGLTDSGEILLPYPLDLDRYELHVAKTSGEKTGDFSKVSYLLSAEGDGSDPSLHTPTGIGAVTTRGTTPYYDGRSFTLGWSSVETPSKFIIRISQGLMRLEVIVGGELRSHYFSEAALSGVFGQEFEREFNILILPLNGKAGVGTGGRGIIINPPPIAPVFTIGDLGDITFNPLMVPPEAVGAMAYIWESPDQSGIRPLGLVGVATSSTTYLTVPNEVVSTYNVNYNYEVVWVDDFGVVGAGITRKSIAFIVGGVIPEPPDLTSVVPLTDESVLVKFTHEGINLSKLRVFYRQLGIGDWRLIPTPYTLPPPTNPSTTGRRSEFDLGTLQGFALVDGLDKNFQYEFKAQAANTNSAYSDDSNIVSGLPLLDIVDFDFDAEIADSRDLLAEGVADVFGDLKEKLANIRDVKETDRLKKEVVQLKVEDAAITQALLVVSTETTAQALSIVEMTANIGTNLANNNSIREALATETSARARSVEGLQAIVDENISQIVVVKNALSTETEARATEVTEVRASVANNKAEILTSNEAIATEGATRASQFNALSVSIGQNTAGINQASQAIVNEEGARVTQYNSLSSSIGSNSSSIYSNRQAITNESSTRASQYNTLSSSIGSNASQIASVDQKAVAAIGYCTISGNVSGHETQALCNSAGGAWVNSPLATAVNHVRVSAGGSTATVGSFYSAYQDLNGQLQGKAVVGVTADGTFTGVEVIGGGDRSFLNFQGDSVKFKNSSGEVQLSYDTNLGKWDFKGKIYADEIVGDTAAGAVTRIPYKNLTVGANLLVVELNISPQGFDRVLYLTDFAASITGGQSTKGNLNTTIVLNGSHVDGLSSIGNLGEIVRIGRGMATLAKNINHNVKVFVSLQDDGPTTAGRIFEQSYVVSIYRKSSQITFI